MNHGHRLYCLMNSGKPLTKTICDVLLYNAYDMYHEGKRIQKLKSRKYEGMIETNLQTIEFNGRPAVSFLANISTAQFENNEVYFVIHLEDFDGLPMGEWQQLEMRVVDPRDICACDKCQRDREECGCGKCQFEMEVIERMENHEYGDDDEDDDDHKQNFRMN